MAVANVVPNEEAFVCSDFYQGPVLVLFDLIVEAVQETKAIAMSNNLYTTGRVLYVVNPISVPLGALLSRRGRHGDRS